jgi:hypothetical protein
MTAEEVKQNYTYKVIKKVITREFPWVKDIVIDEDGLSEYKYVMFFDLFIDPYELANKKGWTVPRWINQSVRDGDDYMSTLLSLYFNESDPDMSRLKELINKTLRTIKDSPAIPEDMRLDTKKEPTVGRFHLADNLTVPNDIE